MKPDAARYLDFVRATRKADQLALDPVEERILDTIAVQWAVGNPVPVVRAMRMIPGLSTSTVQRRLKAMRSRGILAVVPDAIDSRIKYVEGTPATLSHFARLGRLMREAA